MTTETQTPTAEEIAKHYSAAMDSVNLINAGQPEGMTDEDWANENLTPLQDASA